MAALQLAYKNFLIDKSAVEFHEVIGRGGFAHQVYSATVKLPSGDVCEAAAKKVRGIEVKEVSVMKDLDHKNIIKFYGVLMEEFDTYIIMELAENGNLRHYLDECRKENKFRLPSEIVLRWVYEGACGIKYLHDTNHSHRDIKSLNYLIKKDFTIKLGDLGLAKDMDLTQDTSGMRGTCRWMAPEVIMDQRRSVKSDVFSYGTVVWEVFTTEVPYANIKGDFQVMNAICKGERPVIPDDCPAYLRDLISLCWKIDYNERPDMTTICAQLQQRIEQEQTVAEDLSKQLLQTAIDKDEDNMDTVSEDPSEGDGQEQASVIAADCPSKTAISECAIIKTPQEMPVIKQLFARQGLSSTEYVSCDSSNSNSVAMYKMNAVPRGVCLIINNMDFSQARDNGHKLLNDRKGSEVDSGKLCEIFTKFKFSVMCKTDLSSDEMEECFSKLGQQDHSSANAFVCCILSHGKCGQLAGCDGKYVTIQSILHNFMGKRCPSLANKPKIYFIQACQGDEIHEKHTLQVDAPVEQESSGIGTGLDQTAPKEHDFLISLATMPGYASYRNIELGTWYIGILVDRLQKLHEKEDLMSILTDVNRKLSKESTKALGKSYGQMSFPVTTLRKKVFFTLWEKKYTSKSNEMFWSCTV